MRRTCRRRLVISSFCSKALVTARINTPLRSSLSPVKRMTPLVVCKCDGVSIDTPLLVSSEPRPPSQPGNNYMYNDWGPEFRADHGLNFPELSTPSLYMELGSLSLTYLLENRASGYFPRRLVAPHLASGALKLVPRTPVFHYPAYAVYPTEGDAKLPDAVLKNLRKIAAAQKAG